MLIPEHLPPLLVGEGEAVVQGPPDDFRVNDMMERLQEDGHCVLPPGMMFSDAIWTGIYWFPIILPFPNHG